MVVFQVGVSSPSFHPYVLLLHVSIFIYTNLATHSKEICDPLFLIPQNQGQAYQGYEMKVWLPG